MEYATWRMVRWSRVPGLSGATALGAVAGRDGAAIGPGFAPTNFVGAPGGGCSVEVFGGHSIRDITSTYLKPLSFNGAAAFSTISLNVRIR